MNKLLAVLMSSMLVASGAFAASHTGAPMTGASAPKAESKAEEKSETKAQEKADRKAHAVHKRAKKKHARAESKAQEKSETKAQEKAEAKAPAK